MASPPSTRQLAISRDGAVLAVAHQQGRISLFDLKKHKPLLELERTDKRGHWKIALSPDGKRLAATSGSDDNMVIDLKTRKATHWLSYRKHRIAQEAKGLAFTPDGKRVVSAGHGSGLGIFVWEPATGDLVGDKAGKGKQWACMALSKDGRTVVVGDRTVNVYAIRPEGDPEPGR